MRPVLLSVDLACDERGSDAHAVPFVRWSWTPSSVAASLRQWPGSRKWSRPRYVPILPFCEGSGRVKQHIRHARWVDVLIPLARASLLVFAFWWLVIGVTKTRGKERRIHVTTMLGVLTALLAQL